MRRKLKEHVTGNMKDKKGTLKRGTVLKNMSWLIVGSIFRMLIQLIIGIVSARYLGPSNYGVLNYVDSYVTLFSIICELGFTITIVKRLVNPRDNNGETLGTAMVLRIGASAVSIVVLQAIALLMDSGDSIVWSVMLIRSTGLIFCSLNSIHGWYEAKLQSKYPAIIELVAYIISSLYKALILITGKDVMWFAAASVLDSALIGIFYVIFYKKHSDSTFKFSFSAAKEMLRPSIAFIASGIMIYVYGQTDRIMIGKIINKTAVGYYSCAATISTLIGFIAQAIMNSGKPLIMEEADRDKYLYLKKIRQTIAGVMWLMIIYSVGLLLFGRLVVYLLFGEAYLPAVTSMKVLVWCEGFSYVGTIRNMYLTCENKTKYAFLFSFVGAILNIILNLILIPVIGILGASIATVFTSIVTVFVAPLLFSATREFSINMGRAVLLQDVDVKKFVVKAKSILCLRSEKR